MNKQCNNCSKTFRINDQDLAFYKKIAVPEPTLCPDCREQRRLMWHNERTFYNSTCKRCNGRIISMYAPISENDDLRIYCQNCWQSDGWDAADYAMEYDPARSFMEQFYALQRKVPRAALSNNQAVNAPYMNWADRNGNCYMCTSANDNEGCYYGFFMVGNTDCADITYSHNNRMSYELIDCENCNQVCYAQDSRDCNESWFLYNCSAVSNCFGCTNLRMKEYHIFNQPYSKAEYEKKLIELTKNRSSLEQARKAFEDLKKKSIQRYAKGYKNVNTTGGGLTQSQNAKHCFEGVEIVDSAYIFQCVHIRDSYDLSFVDGTELSYEVHSYMGNNSKFTNMCRRSPFTEYSDTCHDSPDVFGCVGLRKKQYCILNKQYSKEEYFELREKIIDGMRQRNEYGEFFAGENSFFAYNETLAHTMYPLTKKEVLARGWRWYEPEEIASNSKNITPAIAMCEVCNTPFKLIQQELVLYERLNVPLPSKCFNCREQQRQQLRYSWKLFKRQCMCTQVDHDHDGRCSTEFETNYSPDATAIIYCEDCYQKEIY